MRRLFAKPPQPPAPRPDPLVALRDQSLAVRPFGPGNLVEGLWWHLDPAMDITGTWSSPMGRMIELDTTLTTPGGWCALHLRLSINPAVCAYIGFVARTAAAHAMVTRACLRSGGEGGFHDQFFARDILSQPGQSDHIDMLVPAHCPDMPRDADWHELVLFLPANRSLTWALHDLRLIAL